jgi:uncharacterized protein (DUF1015 family)
MPKLHPIHALRFATETGDITTKIAPPYDVLDEQPKQALLQGDPHNIVAVDLPVTPPKTVGPAEAYAQAAATLEQWIDADVLRRDSKPAVYAYEQVYTVGPQTFRRRGLFCGLGVEEFNQPHGIWRHEHTIKAGTDDRMLLMKATRCQLSPIFGVFHDEQGEVVELLADAFNREPDFQGTTGNDNVEHRCWVIDQSERIAALAGLFAERDVFIADGHHRYTTALNYSKDHPDRPAAGTCLFVLVAIEDPGMIVLPTHRVLTGLQECTLEKLQEAVANRDNLQLTETDYEPAPATALGNALPEAGDHAMGVYIPGEPKLWLLTTTGDDPLAPLLPHKPEVWRKLDVAVLHELVIDRTIRPAFGGDSVAFKYTADLDDMRAMTDAEPNERIGIIIQATRLADVCEVSLAHEVMPPKSTYFYPKLATGLAINPLY